MAKKAQSIKKASDDYPAHVMEMVAELKKKHNLTEINVISCGDKYCYLKTPDRAIYKMAIAMGDTVIDEAEILLENCWLAGDEEFKTNDMIFVNSIGQIRSLIEYKEVELKKF